MLNTSAARDRLELGREDRLDIRSALLRVLTDLYLQRPSHTPEDERYYTELVLRLIEAVERKPLVSRKLNPVTLVAGRYQKLSV